MNVNKWNPQQYEKFKAQRSKPFRDLQNLIIKESFSSAIDLGCGTGELTGNLFNELKPTKMVGIDSSPEMLAEAEKFKTDSLSFIRADIPSYTTHQKFDLVFSNAALQWVPGHENLIPKILSWIAPDGQIAFQVPRNDDHPSHTIATRVAATMFPAKFTPNAAPRTLSLERYAEILFSHGFTQQIVRSEIYGHDMSSGVEVVEWAKGTLLTAYQAQLTDEQFQLFVETYKTELLNEIGEGPYFYAFKRALIWGKRTIQK